MNAQRLRMLALLTAGLLLLAACGQNQEAADDAGGEQVGIDAEEQAATEPEVVGEATEETGEESADEESAADGGADGLSLDMALASAQVREVNLDDDEEEFVTYCFVDEIQEILVPSGFLLQGFDPAQKAAATSVRLFEDRTECVLAGFEAGTDVTAYTIGVVQNAVVANAGREENIQDAAVLGGSATGAMLGATSAADLVSVSREEVVDRVAFTFDEELDEDQQADASRFAFYSTDGEVHVAAEIVSIEGTTVEVGFGEAGVEELDDATRFAVLDGAVMDRQGQPSVLGAVGGQTAVPDLVSATDVSGAQWDFTFDEPVKDAQAANFILYAANATPYVATDARVTDPGTVRATFDEVEDFADQITRAAAGPEAVFSNDATGDSNTVGVEPVGESRAEGGLTAGPDLRGATLDAAAGQATFVFDEPLEEDLEADPTAFFVVTDTGAEPAPEFVQVTDTRVVLLFDESALEAAAGVSVNEGAVVDEQGNRNPADTLVVEAAA
jgi:hypothetical protein